VGLAYLHIFNQVSDLLGVQQTSMLAAYWRLFLTLFPAQFTVCHDFSGKVLAIGERCTGVDYKVGDAVYGTTQTGTCCERIAVKPTQVAKMPSNASFEEAAALPLAVITTYQVFNRYAILPTSKMLSDDQATGQHMLRGDFALQQNHDALLVSTKKASVQATKL
jgi:NADPH:quinone reductase-like Zn-dependent oxidoreductase